MALAIGISKYSIRLLHLINHAFFKRLLFLGAGIAIHTIKNEQDIRKLRRLIKQTPLTYIGLITASLTITGTPFLTAYFSKEFNRKNLNRIIYWLATYHSSTYSILLKDLYIFPRSKTHNIHYTYNKQN